MPLLPLLLKIPPSLQLRGPLLPAGIDAVGLSSERLTRAGHRLPERLKEALLHGSGTRVCGGQDVLLQADPLLLRGGLDGGTLSRVWET